MLIALGALAACQTRAPEAMLDPPDRTPPKRMVT
jgi:hypothetical protein